MSYCRFSSDNFRCDLYAYENVDGFYSLHVAANRWDEGYPKPIPKRCFKNGIYKYGVDPEADRLWLEHDAIQRSHLRKIGLPHDGKNFALRSLEELRDKMRELQGIGYQVPEYAFKRIEAEIAKAEGRK